MAIHVDSKVRIPPEVLIQELDGESVLLDMRAEKYFGLDETGTVLMQALKANGTIRDAVAAGLAAFDVQPDVLTRDTLELLEELQREGLIVVEP